MLMKPKEESLYSCTFDITHTYTQTKNHPHMKVFNNNDKDDNTNDNNDGKNNDHLNEY